MTAPNSRVCLLALSIGILCCICMPGACAAEHTVAPSGAEFTSIQDAVDWASAGDSIIVKSGVYPEALRLDKKITLLGVDSGGGPPVIDASGYSDTIEIAADGCTLEGFVIQNGPSATGIRILSNDDTIRRNTIRSNGEGIHLISSQRCTITNNNITDNTRVGIVLEEANNNLIESNSVTKNTLGISLDEYSLSNRIFRNNFINNQNVVSKSATSLWNSPDTYTYTYLGQREESHLGNFWSDYRGKDKNSDGIGDISYVIILGGNPKAIFESSQNILDSYPLMDPNEYYTGVALVLVPARTTPAIPPTFITQSSSAGVSVIPSKTIIATTVPVPTITPPAGSGPVLPAGMILIAMLILAGLAGAYLIARRQKEGSMPGVVRITSQAADRLKNVVSGITLIPRSKEEEEMAPERESLTSKAATALKKVVGDRSRSPSPTTPTPRTVLPEIANSQPHTSASEQKNYFPKELENKYTEITYVGRGGIAWVFSARRKSDSVKVAVKIPISFDEVTGKCFLNEIAAWETLMHENIVEVTAVNILPVPYVEMEFVPGSLEAVEKPLPVWKAVHIINGIAAGLQYAHEHGFIHRDIKPHNILLTEEMVPKITDWGMSKVLAADVKKSSIAGFSLSYAAPEQVSPSEFGRTGERTDIYQLGVVFYELVTGSIPFGGESIVEVGNAILRENAILPHEYNPDAAAVEKIIMRCLEKDPARRYQSAAELLDALAGYLDEDDS